MIEMPEAINLAKQLNHELKDKKIKNIIANHSPHGLTGYNGDPANFPKLFNGKTVEGAFEYGRGLCLKFNDNCGIVFADGVNMRYYTDGKLPKKHQLFIEFEDATHFVCTVNLYAGIDGHTDICENSPTYWKPPMFSEQFSMEYFLGLLNGLKLSKHTAKSFLATEQRIPALGNGVLQDILFNASINPKRKLDTLSQTDFQNMYQSVKNTLNQMIQEGGRDVENDIYGKPGGYKTILSRLTYGSPCPRCGGEIKKEAYLGGNIYYCLSCQK